LLARQQRAARVDVARPPPARLGEFRDDRAAQHRGVDRVGSNKRAGIVGVVVDIRTSTHYT